MAISVPFTFVDGTPALAAEVNSNFTQFSTRALDKTGDTMTGSLIFSAANSFDVGSATNAPRSVYADTSFIGAAGALFRWTGRSIISSSADGIINVTNNAGTDFTRINLGGTSSTFPSIGRSTADVQVKLADNSAFTGILVSGVQFPAIQIPSSDANRLDDYEEGSWTPTLTGSGGGSGQVYDIQVGRYVKIGQMVTAWFSIRITTVGTITTNAQINGLPFTTENVGNSFYAGPINWDGMTTTWVGFDCYVAANTNFVAMTGRTAASASAVALVQADFAVNSLCRGMVSYRASS